MAASTTPPLIVIADDSTVFAQGLEYRLKEWQYRVIVVSDLAALNEQLRQELPALLLLDLRFGVDDGVEVLADVVGRFPELAVILLTGHVPVTNSAGKVRPL